MARIRAARPGICPASGRISPSRSGTYRVGQRGRDPRGCGAGALGGGLAGGAGRGGAAGGGGLRASRPSDRRSRASDQWRRGSPGGNPPAPRTSGGAGDPGRGAGRRGRSGGHHLEKMRGAGQISTGPGPRAGTPPGAAAGGARASAAAVPAAVRVSAIWQICSGVSRAGAPGLGASASRADWGAGEAARYPADRDGVMDAREEERPVGSRVGNHCCREA